MPYNVIESGSEFCVVKKSDGKKMGCHPTKEKAMVQMRALYANEAMSSFILVEPFSLEAGKPFRIVPIGEFKRGDRIITITREDVRQMAENANANRPRWKIPVYPGHPTDANPDPPAVGYLTKLEDREDGLYAYPEYNDTGRDLVGRNAYRYSSPGILWTKNGSGYSDEQGNEFTNVIDHLALSNKPFWGEKTAIFSAYDDLINTEEFKDYNTEQRKELAAKGHAMADGSYPIADAADLSNAIHAIGRGNAPHASIKAHIIKRAKAMGKTDMLPEDWKVNMSSTTEINTDNNSDTQKGKTKMAEDTVVLPVVPTVSVEEFNALKVKADAFDSTIKKQAEEFDAKLKAEKERADTFATQFATERKARAIETLNVKAQKLAWLPVKADEYAEKFYELGELKPELAKWFADKFDAVEKLLAQSALFGQVSHDNADVGVDTIDAIANKIVAEKFSGDMTKYKDALSEAGKLRPDLAKAGLMSR